MKPKDVEVFENGDVSLEVHTLSEGDKVYWIKAGVGALQFDFDRFENLLELLNAYDVENFILEYEDEDDLPPEKEPIWPFLVILFVGLIFFTLLGVFA